MSVDYWSVEGYGVSLEGKILDLDKMIELFELDKEDYEDIEERIFEGHLEDIYESELFVSILHLEKFSKHSEYLFYGDTGNTDNGSYILYSPSNPWEMTEEEKNLTKERVDEMIVEVLQSITILSKDEILSRLEDVALGGEG